jgi:hypothetical protein
LQHCPCPAHAVAHTILPMATQVQTRTQQLILQLPCQYTAQQHVRLWVRCSEALVKPSHVVQLHIVTPPPHCALTNFPQQVLVVKVTLNPIHPRCPLNPRRSPPCP